MIDDFVKYSSQSKQKLGNIVCKHEPIDMLRASVLSNSIHMNVEFDCHNSIQETSEIT